MPLIRGKSQKSFNKNVETEMNEGRPQDQSLAIAYSIKRKKKKMAHGGKVELSAKEESRPMPDSEYADEPSVGRNSMKKSLSKPDWNDDTWSEQASRSKSSPSNEIDEDFVSERRSMADDRTSEELDMEKESSNDPMHINMDHDEDIKNARLMSRGGMIEKFDHPQSIAEAIMRKKKMADGGMVDINENSVEEPNHYDDLNEEAALKELYDDNQLEHQPMDSNEHGDILEDEDSHDMVDRIRLKLRSKRMIG